MIRGIKEVIESKDYIWFEDKLNIIGVRTRDGEVNRFDDFLYCVFKNDRGKWIIKQWEITTDPGITSLKNPVNSKGCAILVPYQYIDAYTIDLHRGKYESLCQKLKPVSVYRDSNRDSKHDFDPSTIDTGFFGINIHKAGEESIEVNGWSAGCQVFKRSKDFNEFMSIVKKFSKKYGNVFTYTLLNEE